MKASKRILSILLIITLMYTMVCASMLSALALNSDDYRSWTHRDSRWSGTAMGSGTLGSGGAPTTAVTKLAIQAGLRDAADFNIGDMAELLTNNGGYSGSSIVWNALIKSSLNLFSSYKVLMQGTYTSSSHYTTLINYIKEGYHLVIQVANSSGTTNYVAVDEKLTLASGSKVYIMDCLTNTANNINIVLGKRYSSFARVIGYKGSAPASGSINSDYRKWETNNTNWADTVLNGDYKVSSGNVGGGDMVLAATKLAVQAGLWSAESESGVNSVNRAVAAMGSFNSDGSIIWNNVRDAFGFQQVNEGDPSTPLMGSGSDTATMSTTNRTNIDNIINYLNDGYYLAIRVNNSIGWVAVDTDKTLATGEIYIMRSTSDASKNADIKLSDYYDTINRVCGFKASGVQVNFSGRASFSASYTKDGKTSSIKSGAYVPDGAEVKVTASPKDGYTAGSGGSYWTATGASGTVSADHLTYTFTASSSNPAVTLEFLTSPRSYNINYVYSSNSGSFNYNTTPDTAETGSTVTLNITAKSDATFVYELRVSAEDGSGNELEVTRDGDNYTFTMPASAVTITFEGRNVDDWRKWARDDERWRDYVITTKASGAENTVFTDGAVVLSLAKTVVQAGLQLPTTLSETRWDVRNTVDALNAQKLFDKESAQLYFTTKQSGGTKTSAGALGFDSVTGFLSVSKITSNGDGQPDTLADSKTRGDILSGYADTLVSNIKKGYHQVLRIHKDGSSFTTANSEWVIIDEEKTLAAVGDATTNIPLSSIYIFRATADTNKNAYHTLQEFYDQTTYRYVWRNYAYLGGTTPARKINFTLYEGADRYTGDKASVTAKYTIDGGQTYTEFKSGDYVPSRAGITLTAEPEHGYYAFDNWTTASTDVTSLSATETAKSITFTIDPSEFRASSGSIVNSTVANIRCNITPEDYHIYYEGDEHISFSNTTDTCGYNSAAGFKVVPESGYSVKSSNGVIFRDADDNVLSITPTVSGKDYTFTMPAQDVYIEVTSEAASYDDFRAWGANDSRWSSVTIRPGASVAIGTHVNDGGDIVVGMAKLLIQAGFSANGVSGSYDETDYSGNGSYVKSFITKATSGTSNYIINSSGVINDSSSYYWGWGYMGYNLGIIGTPSHATQGNYYSGATAGGTRSQAFVYYQLLNESTGVYNVNTMTPLLKDYLAGTYSVKSGLSSSYDSPYNTHKYKFHLMLYVNSTYGWVVVDEAQTLNTGEIWVWASHGVVDGNGTSQNNICKLSDLSTTFARAAGIKFADSSNYYGSDKANFTPYYGNSSTEYATLGASYSYLGQTYPSSGTFPSGLYVPHRASVTVKQLSIEDGYVPSTSMTYLPWESTDNSVTATNFSTTNIQYDTANQSAASSQHNYNIRYYIEHVPVAHIKYRGGANGVLRGQTDGSLSTEEEHVNQGGSTFIVPVPDEGYDIDAFNLIKTDSAYSSVLSVTPLDPEELIYYFTSDMMNNQDCYFIVEATFKRTVFPLQITYNYYEYDPLGAGSYEYLDDEHLTAKTHTVTVDSFTTTTQAGAQAAVIANAPELRNNYYDYTLSTSDIGALAEPSGDNNYYSVTAQFVQTPHQYTVTVNGTPLSGTFHFQEPITLDASDYTDASDVIWTRNAESGKEGSATVSFNNVYTFRVTSDLNLTVSENLTSRAFTEGTSTITPAYTEVKPEDGVEKCKQNFFIQDFFNEADPRAFDEYGEIVDDAENITFLGAGAIFYAFDTSTSKPAKSALAGKDNRESVAAVLENNKSDFLNEPTAQGSSFKGSGYSYSYINFSTDSELPASKQKIRFSATQDAYNYFFVASINNNRSDAMQKYVYKAYSFYVYSYELNGQTVIMPVLSENYAQAKLYTNS